MFNSNLTIRELFGNTSVSARWCVPYAVEENLRGMTERKNERMKDRVSGFLLLDIHVKPV